MPVRKTFKHGIKLPVRKHATEGKPIEQAPPPKQVAIPVNQHMGAPNKPIVKVGDKVVRGQKIADGAAEGPMTVPVHASICGVVKKIEPRAQANNTEGLCIIIEADGDTAEEFMPPLDPLTCTREEALTRIREAGILGMGGAGFPTHVKLSSAQDKRIDYIIANGAECEPYLTADDASVMISPQLVIKGLEIVMKITGVKKAVIGLEDNKEYIVPIFEWVLRNIKNTNISVNLCRTRYPQGGEKMLITAITGREVPSGGLPMDVGCIVQNISTLIAISEAFTLGKPLIDRVLSVSGNACKTPKNICAPIGTMLTDLPSEFMEIDYDRLTKIVIGGPMMGFSVHSLNVPIQKNTTGIVLMTDKETVTVIESPCIRCGRCIKKCPSGLYPVIINNRLEAGELKQAVQAGIYDCMECGSCAYICPARIKLVQRFRIGKQRLKMKK